MDELLGDSARGEAWAAVRLWVDGGRIVRADASGLELAGLTLLEAAAVPGEQLLVDALANALGPAVAAEPSSSRVAVAMSGGVDSAVALLAVREAGYEPVGVTLRLWIDPRGPDAERACCSPSAVVAARELCHELGIPHVTLDRREAFRAAVVDPFVRDYADGQTPNPCTRCNGDFRFDELLDFVDRIGAARLATGHYARIVGGALARAADPVKDQSYMLATLSPQQLERLWFPLGGQTKDETRAQALAAGLAAAGRAESQEACFLAGGDYRAFLERHGLAPAVGAIVDEEGRAIGTHDGFWRFTPGQRRGLGVAGDEPLYALRTDARTNAVVAGPRSALARTRVDVRGRLNRDARRVQAKLRYRSAPVDATVEATADGFELRLDEPAFGVAAGQTAVLYDGDTVVGSGTIRGAD
jgi:tRNA-specific 2-thiouridylase